jgi:hypothetical protein
MIETLLAIIGALLGLGLAGILILIGAAVIILLLIRAIVSLIRFILAKPKNEKGGTIE